MMIRYFQIILILFLIESCSGSMEEEIQEFPKSSFIEPFPDRPKNLTKYIGKEFSIKRDNDTLDFSIFFEKLTRQNFIINKENNDTIFSGTVCKYEELLYFNTKLNDTTYWIHAVKIENGTIRGLETASSQMLRWDDEIENQLTDTIEHKTNKAEIVKYIDGSNNIIRLTPIKKEIHRFYQSIIYDFRADTFINWNPSVLDTVVENKLSKSDLIETSNEESQIISKIYPNPAIDKVTLSLNFTDNFQYGIFDNTGRLIQSGFLTSLLTELDLSNIKSGTYFIRVYPEEHEDAEVIKLIIAK